MDRRLALMMGMLWALAGLLRLVGQTDTRVHEPSLADQIVRVQAGRVDAIRIRHRVYDADLKGWTGLRNLRTLEFDHSDRRQSAAGNSRRGQPGQSHSLRLARHARGFCRPDREIKV